MSNAEVKMRVCPRCNVARDVSTRKKVQAGCRTCFNLKQKQYRKEYKKEYLEKQNAWRRENKELVDAYHFRYQQRKKAGLLNQALSRKFYKELYPERVKATRVVFNRLKTGELIKTEFCQSCGNTSRKLNAHHANYSKPLSVVWLCGVCHSAVDKLRLTEQRQTQNKKGA
jgi:ribosomal protein S27AE